ncbi:hypothetical protein H4O09_10090 [Stenotrophomonas sp. W1S232]|uniref:Uncharacterized protein n=1 Tax=Stenotrophomonas koreensis TaxID=266128 RepID=A0A7W3V1K5_9GAMM|nr:hypothetical protein [Stenotrophomonas koreensis]
MSQLIPSESEIVERLRQELAKAEPSRRKRIVDKFVLAALGSIPWVGGFISAAAAYRSEESQRQKDSLQGQWLEEHQAKLQDLHATIGEVTSRFEGLGEQIQERIEDPEYLALVRQAFRVWDEAETDEKRRYVGNIVVNAAGTRVCSDDVVRLFIGWLSLYHEAHFAVIREIYQYPGATRYDIWTQLYGELVREDSAEADLYRLLIRDLSTGGVIRQAREVDQLGRFMRKRTERRVKGTAPTTMESAFEGTKNYVLTELGKQFVHYTMNEVVGRLEGGEP